MPGSAEKTKVFEAQKYNAVPLRCDKLCRPHAFSFAAVRSTMVAAFTERVFIHISIEVV